ncbi:MAG: ADP-ribosylglycohydrolase family protein [Ardenticatenaceae bacterium]|nr:ADP-ribosylglycohydrolase family protein [Ardenticatenaceae bacterium]MCB9444704.1 ADP-ribosylglycohydrolase family protein [Ardenticatenaceae bacterium]
MIGAIAGDVIGSVFERRPIKTTDFPLFSPHSRFTDDTVLTVAVAYAILNGIDYGEAIQDFGRRYPNAGYGGSFFNWLLVEERRPYNSWGNGSAMRVSPVGWAFDSLDAVLAEAEKSAAVTHNHPEGIMGAQATAVAIHLARKGHSKTDIKAEISRRFGYDLERTVDGIRPFYHFDVSCQGSVPESIIAFLESDSVEDAIRKAVSLGGDTDTMGCIAGGIAEAFYGQIPPKITSEVRRRLPDEFLTIIDTFQSTFGR